MLVRNFLKAGCYATIVPVGIPITIRYGDSGLIEQVSVGYSTDVPGNHELLEKFIADTTVPRTIPGEGTSWVQGILFTHNMINEDADAGSTICEKLLDKFMKNSAGFEFFAGNAVCTSREFPNSTAASQWLGIAKYKVLPGIIIPADLTPEKLDAIINLPGYAFDYPLVDGFWIWENGHSDYYSNGLNLLEVTEVKDVVEPASGKSVVDVYLKSGMSCVVDYYEAKKFNIQPGDSLIEDYTGTLLYNLSRPQHNGPIYYKCATCGNEFVLKPDSIAICNNPHCTSTLYPQVSRFLSTLGFNTISHEDYQTMIDKCGKVFMLPDILDLPQFDDVVKDCTLHQILEATIPTKYVSSNSKLFGTLLQDANNNEKTLMYYLQHFDRFLQSSNYTLDCNIQSWLDDPRNLLELQAVIDNPHIKVVGGGKKFEGAPIFRGKTILVTGKFLHGSFDEIKSIFASYSAETTRMFTSSVNCLVIGDTKEDINGSIIMQCRKINLPIFGETEFFNKYEIDADMSENL